MAEAIDDETFMRLAADLSRATMEGGRGGPSAPSSCATGVVIAEGSNEVTSSNDPTAHAEVVAIRRACAAVQDFSLAGATIYSSCEPCPMCLSAIYWARLDRLVYANTRDQAAAIGFDDAFLYDEVPKAPLDRRMPTRHLRSAEAEATFHAWAEKTDKISY